MALGVAVLALLVLFVALAVFVAAEFWWGAIAMAFVLVLASVSGRALGRRWAFPGVGVWSGAPTWLGLGRRAPEPLGPTDDEFTAAGPVAPERGTSVEQDIDPRRDRTAA